MRPTGVTESQLGLGDAHPRLGLECAQPGSVRVDITYGDDVISIADDGYGMTPADLENYFLRVGRDRLEDDAEGDENHGHRPTLAGASHPQKRLPISSPPPVG